MNRQNRDYDLDNKERETKTVQTPKQDIRFPPPDKVWQILGPNKQTAFISNSQQFSSFIYGVTL